MRTIAIAIAALITSSTYAAQPNVIVILTDDQGWGDLSLHGNTNLNTPNIDSLAKNGAQFERFFVQPVCSPTRAELLTGRNHPRGGVRDVSTGGERLNLDEKTIGEAFKAAGYRTACFGKWHNGSQYPYHPNGRGFDEYYGFTSGHWGDYFNPPLDHNGKAVTGKGYLTDDLTDHAIDYIKVNKDKPFFCYLAYNTPHSPMQVPDLYWNRFKDKDLKLKATLPAKEDLPHTRAALAMCENIDDNVGRLLKQLEDSKVAANTIVIYFSDNGPNGWRWNGGMKGRKAMTDEGGVRSPLFIRWPVGIKAGTVVPAIAGAIDLYPTLASLCGVKPTNEKRFDGIDMSPWIKDPKLEPSERILYQHWGGRVSARSQQFRLDADGKLFDIATDPGQLTDVTKQHEVDSQRLKTGVAGYHKDVIGPLTRKDDRPFTVGYPEFPITTLPARDGVPVGTITRSAKAPNCSYFTNWTSTNDLIRWKVDINTAGKYKLEVLQTCEPANIGCEIEFRCGDAKIAAKVTEAHNPKAFGAEHDRVDRGTESYVKDFKSWTMGEVTLAKGQNTIELQALKIPGKQAIEVRSIVLTLMK